LLPRRIFEEFILDKNPDAFRTISEVAEDLNLPQHVLRFWETRFSQIKPMKRGGGRRYYRPDDVDLLKGIRHLLYEEGYTIRGVQKILREQGNKFVIGIGNGEIDISDPAVMVNASNFPEAEDASSNERANVDNRPRGDVKKAVSVEEFTDKKNAGSKASKGILDRLRGRDEKSDLGVGAATVSASDKRNLQAILYELLECKRLLDQVRSD
jgi:DNA-binding transcriptional MerR regulator